MATGCSDPVDSSPPVSTGTIVFGVTSDLRAGVDVKSMHVVVRTHGVIVRDETLASSDGGLHFPLELVSGGLPEGEAIELELEAFTGSSDTPLVTRHAATAVVAGKKLLMRVDVDSTCVTHPGGSGAPICVAPQTCIDGACRDSFVEPSLLETYDHAWSNSTPDICKTAGGGEPVVIVGRGQSDYLPMEDYELAQIEAGPQGGHHVWVAVRLKNLHQSGSITELSGSVPDLGIDVQPFAVIFTFDPDEGGYCKLYGLRFQIDGQSSVEPLFGQKMKIGVKITDKDGDIGVGERWVTLSDGTI